MGCSRQLSLTVLTLCGLALQTGVGHAQWWTAAPADFEDCAERTQKSSGSKDAQAAALSECDAKFAGRRKPGGGYTYHDFMQNRSFDIAGPNPTAAEQKLIDEHYTSYLDNHRRSIIVAAFAEKQREQLAAVRAADPPQPAPVAAKDSRPPVAPAKPRPRAKAPNCATEPLTCGWSRLSAGLKDLTKSLFGAAAKTGRT